MCHKRAVEELSYEMYHVLVSHIPVEKSLSD